jgi:hypothetical protein
MRRAALRAAVTHTAQRLPWTNGHDQARPDQKLRAAVNQVGRHLPWRNGNGKAQPDDTERAHVRAIAIASATAGLAVGTVAGAFLFSHRDRRTSADGSKKQARKAKEG